MTFPVAVILKRLAAPRCVFNLSFFTFFATNIYLAGFLLARDPLRARLNSKCQTVPANLKPVHRMLSLSPGGWRGRFSCSAALWREKRHHDIRFHSRSNFDQRMIGNFLQKPVHFCAANFLMRHFAAAMEDHRLNLVPLTQKLNDLVLANLVVMFRGCRPELDFLELRTLLVFALLMRFLVGLVKVLAVVGDLANRRIGGRRDFHQVQPPITGKLDRFKWRHHTQLSAIFVHNANFTRPDAIVYANPVSLPKTPFSDNPTSKNYAPPRMPRP
jgi:hypothetical protein